MLITFIYMSEQPKLEWYFVVSTRCQYYGLFKTKVENNRGFIAIYKT